MPTPKSNNHFQSNINALQRVSNFTKVRINMGGKPYPGPMTPEVENILARARFAIDDAIEILKELNPKKDGKKTKGGAQAKAG